MNNIIKRISVIMLCGMMALSLMPVNASAAGGGPQNQDQHGKGTYHEAVAATCTEAGTVEYWDCKVSGCTVKYDADGNVIEDTTDAEGNTISGIIDPAKGHSQGTHHAAVAATCNATGTVEYWDCANNNCGAKLDADGSVITDITVPATGHSKGNYHEAVAATCNATGTVEYWDCANCGAKINDQLQVIAENKITVAINTSNHGQTEVKDFKQAVYKGADGYTGDTYCKVCGQKIGPGSAFSPPTSVTLSQTTYTYDGKSHIPDVTVTCGNNPLAKENNYTISYPEDVTNVGTKTVTVTFTGNYSGTETLTYTIVPKTTVSLTLGNSLSVDDVAGNGTFSLDSKYTKAKGNYKFTLKNKNKIITYTYGSKKKINYSKLDTSFKVKWTSSDKKTTKTIKVNLKLPTPTVTIKKSKTKDGYKFAFNYNYTNASSVKIRLKGLGAINKNFDKYTKKYKKSSNYKLFATFKKSTCKKLGYKMVWSITVKYGKFKSQTITKTFNNLK